MVNFPFPNRSAQRNRLRFPGTKQTFLYIVKIAFLAYIRLPSFENKMSNKEIPSLHKPHRNGIFSSQAVKPSSASRPINFCV